MFHLHTTKASRSLPRVVLQDTGHVVGKRLLERLPTLLTTPLLQQGQSLRLVGSQRKLAHPLEVVHELDVWVLLPENGQQVVPVARRAPSREACIFDIGVEDGGDMEQRSVLDVVVDGCKELAFELGLS